MNMRFIALLLPLAFSTSVFADIISISIPLGAEIVDVQPPTSASVKFLTRADMQNAADLANGCIATLVVTDGEKGQPMLSCPPADDSEISETDPRNALSPISPQFDLSAMGFR